MVEIYTSKLFLEHDTGHGHPERPDRVGYAIEQLTRSGTLARCHAADWTALDETQLATVHDPNQVRRIRAFAEHGGGRIEVDTVCSRESYRVAASAAGAATAAVDAVIRGPNGRAFCLTRPPGHHATRSEPMGFCLFNNIAIAAQYAMTQHRLDRVLIVDWDVHHGNGTQDIFYSDPRVMFFSIHRYPFYPGTGAASETGTGAGIGYTRNEPITFGTARNDYRNRFDRALQESAEKTRPQLVLVSAGFDAHARDPIGSLGLEIEDFVTMTQSVIDVANAYAGGRLVSLLEGGYNISILADCIEAHLIKLLDA